MSNEIQLDNLEKMDEINLIMIMFACHKGGNTEKRDRARDVLRNRGIEVSKIFNSDPLEA